MICTAARSGPSSPRQPNRPGTFRYRAYAVTETACYAAGAQGPGVPDGVASSRWTPEDRGAETPREASDRRRSGEWRRLDKRLGGVRSPCALPVALLRSARLIGEPPNA